jgi:hypothetical protein
MKKNSHPSQAKARHKHRGKARKRPALSVSRDASLPAWPSLGELREHLRSIARGEPECPYRFDLSL